MENNRPKVSIIIPVYNGSNFLTEAINSALSQTYHNIEVLVINDGSNDNGATRRIAESFGNKIRYYEKRNGGVATALNLGIREMSGEYFSWLSHDDRYKKDKIAKEVASLTAKDRNTIVCGGCDVINEKGDFLFSVNPYKEYGEKLNTPLFALFNGYINGCCLLIHKSHFERVGTFDERYPTTQDYDLWFRMMRGQEILFLNECLVEYREHSEQGSRKLGKKHIDECNDLWVRLLNTVTEDEMIQMSGNRLNFLLQEKKFFARTSYERAAELVDDRLSDIVFGGNNIYKLKYEAIVNSTCWKITGPLRKMADMVKRRNIKKK